MNPPPLSENYIRDYIARWILPPPGSVFQVLGTKKIQGDASGLKFRLCLSDGVHRFSQAMLQLPDMTWNVPAEYSIIRMNNSVDRPNTIFKMSNKLIWIVKDFEVVAEMDSRIGNPVPVDPTQFLSNPADQETAAPTTPSPSGKACTSNGVSAPPAGPSKRPLNVTEVESDPRTKQARRALFTDSAMKATQSIANLSPFTNKFTIKARVTKKSDLREFHNSRSSGKVFDVVLQDASGEIKASCFNDVATKFSQIFKENRVYFVSMAFVKSSNPAFNPTKHPYELSLTTATEVTEVQENLSADVPSVQFDYVSIGEVQNKPENELVDVIGVCSGVDDLRDITVRSTGRQVKKRDIKLTDEMSDTVTVTLWSQKAEDFDKNNVGKVVRIRRAKVNEFNGKSLTLNFSSSVEMEPKNCPEAERLRGWWADNKQNGESTFSRPSASSTSSQSEFSTLRDIITAFRDVSVSDPAKYHKFEAYVVDVKADNVMYQACSSCNKKVDELDDGRFRCSKCAVTQPECSWRYIIRAAIADMTDYQWVTLFDDSAKNLVGIPAKELRSLFNQDPDLFRRQLHQIKFSLFEFSSKTKCEKFNDENRIKMTITSAAPITNHGNAQRVARLRKEIESLKQSLNGTPL